MERFQGDLVTFCALNNLDMHKQVFQQDEAISHTAHENVYPLQSQSADF